MLRPEYNKANKVAKAIERSEDKVRTTAEKLTEDVVMNGDEAWQVVQFFGTQAESLCRSVGSSGEVSSLQLHR